MATSINTLKNWFKTNLFPTQAQFWALIDSFRHKDEKVPVADIEGLNELLDLKADAEQVTTELALKADKTYVDNLVTGLWDDRGSYDASTNLFPSTGGSGTDGDILKGDIWTISVAGTLGDEVVQVGDTVRALVDAPSEPSDWAILQNNIGYIPLNYDIDNYSTVSLPLLNTDKFLINRSGAWRKLSWLDTLNSIKAFILGGEIQLPAYTSARNDGANPNNKVLNVDASGNLKLYSMPIMPPPFLEELIPDSYLPSNTGNFIVKGSFFTPTTTVTVEGQTLNYLTFVSDNEILVNLTTGVSEGTFDVTINNGIEVVFPNALLIISGEVFQPLEADWINTSVIDVTETGAAKIINYNSLGNAEWTKQFNYTIDFAIRISFRLSPLGSITHNNYHPALRLYGVTSGVAKCVVGILRGFMTDNYNHCIGWDSDAVSNYPGSGLGFTTNIVEELPLHIIEIRNISGIVYVYNDGVLKQKAPATLTENLKLVAQPAIFDVVNIKYIELT